MEDYWLQVTAAGEWVSPFGRVSGLCGAIVGLQFVVNLLVLICQSMWVGCVKREVYFHDGVLGPPRKVMSGPIGKGLGAIIGLGFGWRSVIDFFLMGLRSAWYGQKGRLYKVYPPNVKLERNIDGSLSVVALTPDSIVMNDSQPKIYMASPLHDPEARSRKKSDIGDVSLFGGGEDGADSSRANRRGSSRTTAAGAGQGNVKKIHPQSIDQSLAGVTRRKTVQLDSAITEESAAALPLIPSPSSPSQIPKLDVINARSEAELHTSPATAVASSPPAVIDVESTLPSYGGVETSSKGLPYPLSSPMSAATILPPENSPPTPQPKPIESQAVKLLQMYVDDSTAPRVPEVPHPQSSVKMPSDWWSKPSTGEEAAMGRGDDEWLTEGATTLSGKIAGPLVLSCLIGTGSGLAAWYAYLPSRLYRSSPSSLPTSEVWWYDREWAPLILITLSGAVMGVIIAVIGIRNAFNPLFFSRTVVPAFIEKVWFPALLPTLELVAVLVSLAIYLPIMCTGATIRRVVRSFWFLIRAILCISSGGSVRLPAKEQGRNQGLRITGIKFLKSFLRIGLFTGVIVIMGFVVTPILTDPWRGALPLYSAILISIATILIAIPCLDLILKFTIASHRLQPMTESTATRLTEIGLTLEEAKELDILIVSRIAAVKMGGSATDPAGPLRIWIRTLGLWCQDEVRLKKIHNVYRDPASKPGPNISSEVKEGGVGSVEVVLIRGLDAESQRKVAEARSRRSSNVPKNVLPTAPGADTHRPSWSRRVSEALVPALATFRRNSEVGKPLGYFTDPLSGRPLGELFEVENRFYRLVLESNGKLWIWMWLGETSQNSVDER
ncbi:hypothetical protein HDU67_010050 [Dinochytrium kinnereticum]|nr:hypothetical protein HDU67_010050 [Dinochytrium kinnereticum]